MVRCIQLTHLISMLTFRHTCIYFFSKLMLHLKDVIQSKFMATHGISKYIQHISYYKFCLYLSYNTQIGSRTEGGMDSWRGTGRREAGRQEGARLITPSSLVFSVSELLPPPSCPDPRAGTSVAQDAIDYIGRREANS